MTCPNKDCKSSSGFSGGEKGVFECERCGTKFHIDPETSRAVEE